MKQILCFGDSNTYGLVPATTDRYGWGVRWTSIINEKLGLQEYRVIEEGLCGRTTVFDDPFREGRRGTQLFPSLLETHRLLDCIVIMLGTNDCKTVYGASAGVIAKGVEKLIEQAQRFAKDTPILLISPIHLGEGVWEKGFDTEFNENSVAVSKGLAEEYRKVSEKYGLAFLNAADYAQPGAADREHLDEERKMFDERFLRMWELYLSSCAATFHNGIIDIHQILCTKGINNEIPMVRWY